MAQERTFIDISDEPALRELVQEIRTKGTPVVLQIGNEDVAVLTPSQRRKKKGGGVLRPDDPLFDLMGILDSGIPGGIPEHKHEALLRAKRNRSR